MAAGMTRDGVTFASFRDGTSNTVLLWESSSKKWFSNANGALTERSWDDWADHYGEAKFLLNENQDITYGCAAESLLAYMYGWAGVNRCRVRVWDEQGLELGSHLEDPSRFSRVINVTNSHRSPFSFHTNICNVAIADGSVRSVHQDITPSVFIALTTRRGGEVVELP